MKRVGALMIPTLIEERRYMLAWVEMRMDQRYSEKTAQPIGIVRGGKMVCVWVYDDLRRPNIFLHVCADHPSWCTRPVLRALLGFPFSQWECERITALIVKGNKRSVKLTEGAGFKREGVMRKASKHNKDLLIFGLLRKEYDARYGVLDSAVKQLEAA